MCNLNNKYLTRMFLGLNPMTNPKDLAYAPRSYCETLKRCPMPLGFVRILY